MTVTVHWRWGTDDTVDRQIRFSRLPIVPMTRERVNPACVTNFKALKVATRRGVDDYVQVGTNERPNLHPFRSPVIDGRRSSFAFPVACLITRSTEKEFLSSRMGIGGTGRGRPVAMRSHPPFLFLEEHTDMTDGMNVSQTNQHAT
jgi:hypothetical protein